MSRIQLETGKVQQIVLETYDQQLLEVRLMSSPEQSIDMHHSNQDMKSQAKLYFRFCTRARIGDIVLVNRTATNLKLGSGGVDYVVSNLSHPEVHRYNNGHIMKLRYTPMQFSIQSIEETAKYQRKEENFSGLNAMPVVIGELHSMVVPFVTAIRKFQPQWRIVYLMSDGGALPLELSYSIKKLKESGDIDITITFGNAYGGDLEATNIFTALIAAHQLCNPDVIIATMGPGIVGTGSKYGFTGMEQLQHLYAVELLKGHRVLIPRIGFSDGRTRHWGVSHHTKTVLELTNSDVSVTFPILEQWKHDILQGQLVGDDQIFSKHNLTWIDVKDCLDFYRRLDIELITMGKNLEAEPAFFQCVWATAKKVALDM